MTMLWNIVWIGAGLIAAAMAVTAFAATTQSATAPSRQRDDLAVMTFNIRYMNDHDGPNGWAPEMSRDWQRRLRNCLMEMGLLMRTTPQRARWRSWKSIF